MHATDFLFDREKPAMPSNVLSLMQLRTMPLHDQVKTLLTNGKQSMCGNIKKGVIHVSVWSLMFSNTCISLTIFVLFSQSYPIQPALGTFTSGDRSNGCPSIPAASGSIGTRLLGCEKVFLKYYHTHMCILIFS